MYLQQNTLLGYVVFSYSVLKNYATCNVISHVEDFVLLPIIIILLLLFVIFMQGVYVALLLPVSIFITHSSRDGLLLRGQHILKSSQLLS
jgi:hypothetical protein